MARKPTEQPQLKPQGYIGAYRTEGGRFAAFDATGRTKFIDEVAALAIGIREG